MQSHSDETMNIEELVGGMEEVGIRVVAHIVVRGIHYYNLSEKQMREMGLQQNIKVLKLARDEIRRDKKKVSNKLRLYNVAQ